MYIKNRKAKIEIYIIPFVIITLMTYLTVIIMDKNIENYFYDLKKQESLKISRNISKNLSHTGSAVDNIFSLASARIL